MTASVWNMENHYFVAMDKATAVGGFAVQVRNGDPSKWEYPLILSTRMGSGGPFAIRSIGVKKRKRALKDLTDTVMVWGQAQGKQQLVYLGIGTASPTRHHVDHIISALNIKMHLMDYLGNEQLVPGQGPIAQRSLWDLQRPALRAA